MEGWISLHRSIKEHWIWNDPVKFQWWIDILLSVNHSETKVNIGYDLIECKRGQSIKSLQTWAKQFNCSKDTARNFLKLLEKDHIISLESLQKTTRLTVCNYDKYQDSLHEKQTTPLPQTKRKANATPTQTIMINNENNENNNNTYSGEISNNRSKKDYIDQIIECFANNYLKYRDVEYFISNKGKERKHASCLLSEFKKYYPDLSSDEMLEKMDVFFKASLNIKDKFYYPSMTLPFIITQFNQIRNVIKDVNFNKKVGVSDIELAGVITKHFATDYKSRSDQIDDLVKAVCKVNGRE